MFLFLSKLLPLFIYPLGLTCLLLVIALVLLWQKPRLAAVFIVLALSVVLVSSNQWVTTELVQSLEWQHLPPAEMPSADAIVVLGGGTRSAMPPRPFVDVQEGGDRIIYAAQLYRQQKAPIIIVSGGRIAWNGKRQPSESSDMAQLLDLMGVPKSAIIEEPESLNTYENAVNVNAILKKQGINQVLLITSATHMPRAMGIFQKQGIEAIAAPTDFWVTQGDRNDRQISLQARVLNTLPDADRLQQTTRALKEYVGLVVYRLRGWL